MLKISLSGFVMLKTSLSKFVILKAALRYLKVLKATSTIPIMFLRVVKVLKLSPKELDKVNKN